MDKLKHESVIGFREGWLTFWSPFVSLYEAIAATWQRHLGSGQDSAADRHHS